MVDLANFFLSSSLSTVKHLVAVSHDDCALCIHEVQKNSGDAGAHTHMFIRPSHSRFYLLSIFIYFTVAYVALVFVFNCNRRDTNVSMMMMMIHTHTFDCTVAEIHRFVRVFGKLMAYKTVTYK